MRKAKFEDLEKIMNIIKEIVQEMKELNNPQWNEDYPNFNRFKKDMDRGELYVLENKENGEIEGFVCLNCEEAKEYSNLKWSLEEKALNIHRMGVNPRYRQRGKGCYILNFAEKVGKELGVRYLKTDTYIGNIKMNNLFIKFGFKYVGKVKFKGENPKFNCYEKII